MAENKVMKLWTAIVTAFLALCTALGLVTATTATTAAAAPRSETPDTATSMRTVPAIPTPRHWARSHASALPPTMKQRIRAEAHGKTPSCRHRPDDATEADRHRLLDTTEAETTAHPDHSSSESLDC